MSSLLELKEVVHALDQIADKYFEVGVQLGLKPELLRRIEGEHPSFTRRLCEIIHSWQINNSSERCTWSTLAEAVARVGGHDNLLCELRKRGNKARQPCGESEDSAKDTGYSTKSDWTTSSGSETATDTSCTVVKIEGHDDFVRGDQRGNNTPPLPSESGAEDTGYSTKSDSAISDTESSSGSETERFELVPGCGCKEKPCSLPTLCARGCPNPTRERIPVLQKKKVGVDSQDELPIKDEDDCEDFETETKKIQKHFGKFITDICCSFKKRKVNIKELALFLQTSFPVMKPRSKELDQATCFEQIFTIVADQACSWFDYEVIKDMIEYFGSSDKDRAQVYEEEFKKYAKQRLPKGKKHIEIGSGAKVGTKQLVIKIDKEWEEVNFNDLDKLRSSFASILGVRRRDLYLADVREGCMMMTFMIQEELANKLFPTKSCLTTKQIHSLKSESVISVRYEKLSWRSSAMASNKTESTAIPGPIEPQTWGASTTVNDVNVAVTDRDALTPFPLVADEMHPPVLYRTPAMASNRIIPIHESEALDQKFYRSEDGPPVHKEDELCEDRLVELDQKLKLYCSQERGEIAEVLQPLAYKNFEDGVQLDVSGDTLQCITKENPTISRRLYKTIHSSQENKCGESEDSANDTGYSEKSDWTTSSGSETATDKSCTVVKVKGHDVFVRGDQGVNNASPLRPLPSESGAEDTGYSTKSDSPIYNTESSSGSETERFELVPGCGCGKEKPCSLYTLCARGCPNPTRRRIPVLQIKRVGAVTQDDLLFEDEDDCEDYERATRIIQKCFGKFVKGTCCSFKERKVNIETLTSYLQSSFPVMKPRSKELDDATSMEQVFKIVVDQACSWFDYEVIVSIIEEFGESSDKDHAQMYKEEFKKYAEQRLLKGNKHIEIGSGAKVGSQQLVIKIDKEWDKVNINELDKLRGTFASILGVRRRDLYLADVREGCIMMTFMIQEELANKLFPTKRCLTAEQIHSLKGESVISVRCGKFSWRSSAMASNKTESTAMPGPIEPRTWGASTTANDGYYGNASLIRRAFNMASNAERNKDAVYLDAIIEAQRNEFQLFIDKRRKLVEEELGQTDRKVVELKLALQRLFLFVLLYFVSQTPVASRDLRGKGNITIVKIPRLLGKQSCKNYVEETFTS